MGDRCAATMYNLAKMIEVAQSQWFDRPNYKGVHYNYYADRGKVFIGKFYISCRFAKETVQRFGLGQGESTVIQNRGHAETFSIPALKLTEKIQNSSVSNPNCST